jgi:uncharacterized protein YceK
MMKALLIMTVVTLSGCSSLAMIESRLTDGIDAYCQKSATERAGIRAAVNEKLAPHEIRVTCFGDDAGS